MKYEKINGFYGYKISNFLDREKAANEVEDLNKVIESLEYRGVIETKIFKGLVSYKDLLLNSLREFDKNNLP